jgi:hypothetical protein
MTNQPVFPSKFSSLVTISASAICLISTIVTHLIFAELRNLPGLNLMSLSVDTLIYQLIFISGVHPDTANNQKVLCKVNTLYLIIFLIKGKNS